MLFQMHGLLILDKPPGLSSAAAVSRVKRLLPRGTKIGHAGTLDPFATGLLLLLIGRATKMAEQLMSQPKQYLATLKLGATTETLDPESPEIPHPNPPIASCEQIESTLQRFIGTIQQQPPIYSALKIAGRPAYALAREGQSPKLAPRPVTIYSIKLLRYEYPLLDLQIDCGRGTYIRSLAADIGTALGSAAYLTSLRRTRIGDFALERAVTLDHLDRQLIEASLLTASDGPKQA